MSLAENLYAARTAAAMSQPRLAVKAGVSQQLVSQIERGIVLHTTKLPLLARALNVSVASLDPDFAEEGPAPVVPLVGGPLSVRGDLPVYASAQGGRGGLLVTFEAIDYVGRPASLANVKDGYGMYITGDSMSSRYEPGDLALVNPHKPHRSGDDAVLYRYEPAGEVEAVIKRLIRKRQEQWELMQFNPEKKLSLPVSEWPVCHVIVGRY